MRRSRMLGFSVTGGCLGFFFMMLVAQQMPSSFIATTVNRLGVLYGVLLFTVGLYAMLVTTNELASNAKNETSSKTLWIVGLPTLVGLIGVLHGYLSLATSYWGLPSDIVVPHATVWTTAIVGALLTIAIAALRWLGSRVQANPKPIAR